MLEEFDDLISRLCANSPITQEEHRDRLFFTDDGLIFDSLWERNGYFTLVVQNAHHSVAATCGRATQPSLSISWIVVLGSYIRSPQLMESDSTTVAARHSRERLVTHTCTGHDSN